MERMGEKGKPQRSSALIDPDFANTACKLAGIATRISSQSGKRSRAKSKRQDREEGK
jgi:hypothetical protein